MKHPRFSHRPRPPWWPANEEWPPRRWRGMRGQPFFRRMGCLFFLFAFFACTGFLGLMRFALGSFIEIPIAPPLNRADLLLPLGFLGLMILLAAFFWGARMVRRISMPLDDLLAASQKVAEGDYGVRVDVKGTPEMQSLVQGFNAMTERLQINDQQRRAMLADVSHELRTPITVIQGNIEGILDGLYPADEARLKSIQEEAQILARLVDDLRTLALAESGSLQLKREPTDLAELIRDAVAGFSAQAEAKHLRLELSLPDLQAVELDPVRTREVLTNLLSNALRYTPDRGKVRIGVEESASGEERGVTVFVQDSGPGIAPADLARIFERFYKSSDSGGMGLGLSIAKYLVEAHGGRIGAASPPGEGTRVWFWLPAEPRDTA